MNYKTDLEQRRRAVEETHRSFVVEASAGTGKTTTLIRRILHLVLERGPAGPPVPLSRICAITFTEKAAGEMKIRLRQGLEEILFDPRTPAAKSDLAREALKDLETASISTFHSFAVSLLKERPIEAGLDPHFTPLDELRTELFFREVWESWISRALAERRPVLEKALRGRIGLNTIQDLARTLRSHEHAVRLLDCDSPPGEDEIRAVTEQLLRQGRRFAELSNTSKDKLVEHLGRALNWLSNLRENCEEPSKPGNAGSAANWTGGKETVNAVQNFIKEVAEFCRSCKKLPFQHLLNDLICFLKDEFLAEWESRKRAAGFVDFDDQLWLTRQLLIRSPAVRREFQERYVTLLIDEFQDTDSVQWHIVLLLASSDPDETDIARLRPSPGKLFIVGDPKQSIYRFRTADIETYLKIVEPASMKALGTERLELTTNLRSVPSILRFADDAFQEAMIKCAYQPAYLPFGGHGERPAESNSHVVYILGNRKDGDAARTARESVKDEAAQIAGLIKRIRGSESWKVEDPYEPKDGGRRAPRFGDIAILMPVLSHADILEDALRDAEIPYVLEGGKFYYARSEVSSAITVLRAIANPNDTVALYGSLRSIYFGFSDQELLRCHSQGERFDYRRQLPPESPLHHAFEILLDLHLHRHDRRASETLEILLQRTGAREALAAHGLQSLANLNKLIRTLRSLQGELTFSQVVELLSTMDEEGIAESESRLMEERSDAVRIMSIHKSKGLDFPIVFVAGLGQKRLRKYENLLADFHREKVYSVRIGYRESALQSPRWKELAEAERKREEAELIRLLYVALTRARDHLVISAQTPKLRWIEEVNEWIPETSGTRLDPLQPVLVNSLSGKTEAVRWLELDEKSSTSARPSRRDLLPGMNDWIQILEDEYKQLHAIIDNTPSAKVLQAAADESDSAREDRIPESVRNRAIRLGVAFHEAMERTDFFSRDFLQHVQETGTRHNLDPESIESLEEMIRTSMSSGLLDRARAAANSGGRLLREVPFVRPLSEGLEEGKIDLLFEEAAGWVLVDYKTDQVPANPDRVDEDFRGKYAGQIREYLEALRSLSIRVQSAYLLLARTGHAVKMM
jgi:ATP-dependent helicase/nuclease subunit A